MNHDRFQKSWNYGNFICLRENPFHKSKKILYIDMSCLWNMLGHVDQKNLREDSLIIDEKRMWWFISCFINIIAIFVTKEKVLLCLSFW